MTKQPRMKSDTYIVEIYDTKLNLVVHSMMVIEGAFVQSDYDAQLAILNSEPKRYKRNIIPVWEDGDIQNSAPEEIK